MIRIYLVLSGSLPKHETSACVDIDESTLGLDLEEFMRRILAPLWACITEQRKGTTK